MSTKPRLRFAPSPTGKIHIGNIRTALFNWLYARNINGEFIIRVEDTDAARSVEEYEQIIFDALKWLGLGWDEGPQTGGDYGPYRQSERKDIYREYADKLLESGDAYYCYCSEEDLEKMREEQKSRGEMPRYDGRCAELTEEERQRCENEGRTPVIRFKVPKGKDIQVCDLVKGNVNFESDGIGDFIIIKSDGLPSYNFACAIDDYLMDITHVLRGEDHLSNTPRQVMVYNALGFDLPYFGHLSLILGHDKAKLSKRHGDTFIGDYQEKGYLPEAIMNFLALLGWSPEGEEELFAKEQLVEKFDINRVAKSAAVFDVSKLNWMNSHYIKNTEGERLLELSKKYLLESNVVDEQDEIEANKDWYISALNLVKEKVYILSEIPEQMKIFEGDTLKLEDKELQVLSGDNVVELLKTVKDKLLELESFDPKSIKKTINEAGKLVGVKGKQLFMPVRVAVSGQTHGPEIDQLISLLGRNKIEKRIDSVIEQIQK
ncbi:glutamate--tRNA ligase [Natranaerobius trueperi]|uniref:Glutamate--tRNA ligase n=1 Tax=Natranaerobius trueperi TaxID=759412 RepID=A0A226C008_9FIRM|nr:glutamate--tRNA ligase [Natranaerobius trueperi]OWZ84511.1 glutamate--tRNA ligase [Natranaerobius trueperi]